MGSTVINCDADTKAAVASYAAERGISQTKALAEMVARAQRMPDVVEVEREVVRACEVDFADRPLFDRLVVMAAERFQSPAETLSDALDALARPTTLVTPAPRTEPVWEGGVLPCRCDGPETVGSHHRTGCHNRRDQ